MLKPVMTLLLAVTIFLGWTAFTGDQAAADQPLNVRTDAHLRGIWALSSRRTRVRARPLSPSLSVPLLCSPAVASPPSGFIRPLCIMPRGRFRPAGTTRLRRPGLIPIIGVLIDKGWGSAEIRRIASRT